MRVYHDRSRRRWTLDREIGEGGEAVVYAVRERSDFLAKIYRPAPPPDYEQKLNWMLGNPPDNPTDALGHAAIAWPNELLYDPRLGLVGFLMGRIPDGRPLFDVANPKLRAQIAPGFDRRYLHRTASNLASAVDALHEAGYVVGDLNESNVLVTPRALTTIIDADSFQVREQRAGEIVVHRCRVGKLDYTPPELQGQALGSVERTPAHDRFALAVLVFQLLMEGAHPFNARWLGAGEPPSREERIRLGQCPYVNPTAGLLAPPAHGVPFDTLAPHLAALMRQCFVAGHGDPEQRPSAAAWEEALEAAERGLIRCSHGHLYANHLTVCPWCAGRIPVVVPRPRPRPTPPRQERVDERRMSAPVTPMAHHTPPPSRIPRRSPPQPPASSWTQFVGPVVLIIFVLLWLMGQRNDSRPPPRSRTTTVRATSVPTAPRRPTAVPTVRLTETPVVLPASSRKAYPIAAAEVSGNAGRQSYAWDGNTRTTWYDNANTSKASPYLEIDLGSEKPIGEVRWWLAMEGTADAMRIRVYGADRRIVYAYLAPAEGPAVKQWHDLRVDARARYIRFEFPNPRGDGVAGGLAEVDVVPPQFVPGATPKPPPQN